MHAEWDVADVDNGGVGLSVGRELRPTSTDCRRWWDSKRHQLTSWMIGSLCVVCVPCEYLVCRVEARRIFRPHFEPNGGGILGTMRQEVWHT